MSILQRILWRLYVRAVDSVTERRERHGIKLSMYIESAPLQTDELWPKLETALDLINEISPVWIRRMVQMENTVDVRRIPGTRAELRNGSDTILDPYLLANFKPAQIASSIVHEATHAFLYWKGMAYEPEAPAAHERVCRRAEWRFGRKLKAAGTLGADEVLARVCEALSLEDEDIGVVIDREELRVIRIVTRLRDLPGPRWLKRFYAWRAGVLNTPMGRDTFGYSMGKREVLRK